MNIDAQPLQQSFQSLSEDSGLPKSDKDLLHGYIYDYLIKHKYVESAKIFFKEADVVSNGKTTSVSFSTKQSTSPSSSHENTGQQNAGGPDSSNNDSTTVNGVSSSSSNSSTPRPFGQDQSRNSAVNGIPASRKVCH